MQMDEDSDLSVIPSSDLDRDDRARIAACLVIESDSEDSEEVAETPSPTPARAPVRGMLDSSPITYPTSSDEEMGENADADGADSDVASDAGDVELGTGEGETATATAVEAGDEDAEDHEMEDDDDEDEELEVEEEGGSDGHDDDDDNQQPAGIIVASALIPDFPTLVFAAAHHLTVPPTLSNIFLMTLGEIRPLAAAARREMDGLVRRVAAVQNGIEQIRDRADRLPGRELLTAHVERYRLRSLQILEAQSRVNRRLEGVSNPRSPPRHGWQTTGLAPYANTSSRSCFNSLPSFR